MDENNEPLGATANHETVEPARVPFPDIRSKIQMLPEDLKAELDKRLVAGTFRSAATLSKWLKKNGYKISDDALLRYGRNFDRRLQAIRLATEQARIVCAQFKDDDIDMQNALLRLVQTQLFEVLAAVKEIPKPRLTTSKIKKPGRKKLIAPPEKIASVNITALARSVSSLARVDAENRRYAERARAAVASAAKKLDDARGKGLSPNAANQIRAVLMEI